MEIAVNKAFRFRTRRYDLKQLFLIVHLDDKLLVVAVNLSLSTFADTFAAGNIYLAVFLVFSL